jgi:hypothetical protein
MYTPQNIEEQQSEAFSGEKGGTQGLQTLYHLSHNPSPFAV